MANKLFTITDEEHYAKPEGYVYERVKLAGRVGSTLCRNYDVHITLSVSILLCLVMY
jgi:hypothetical protein